jgi:multidrug efflux system membrane fusion protein
MCKILLRKKKIFIWLLLILAIGFGYVHFKNKPIKKDVYPVEVTKVMIQPMPVLLQAPGSVEPVETVGIMPQVTGTILRIAFAEGERVEENQLLFELDPAPFLENLKQAIANLAKDDVTLMQNIRDAKRYQNLAQLEFVTRQQAEQAQMTADAQRAVVDADIALVRQAEIQLSYTQIHSPLKGKTGAISVKPGDLVVANAATPLVVINQLDAVLIDFNLIQADLKRLLAYHQKGTLQVEVGYEGEENFLKKGDLVFIDNMINSQTGTLLLKAKVNNVDNALWPGMMVAVNLILTTEPRAIVVPATAIQIDQQGNFVYCVEENKVKVHRVDVSRQVQDLAVIAKGLSGLETVITTIPPDLAEGDWVEVLRESL